jgi:glycosyltransferase involved in cell wall biosynthesis
MKITMVNPFFYPFRGGTENYVLDLSKYLVSRGHEVDVICSREKGQKKEELVALAKALKFFEEHYREEITSEDEEPMLLFYLGELNKLLGNRKEAVKWFSTLVNKYRGFPSPYVKEGQKRWQEIRDSHE